MKVTAFQGKVMTAAAYVYAIAVNARPLWPFIFFILISAVSGSVGWGIYRDDGPGQADGADAGHEEPSPVSR